jgi:hypothetical protein
MSDEVSITCARVECASIRNPPPARIVHQLMPFYMLS